jgi:hypothetical protein
MTVRHLTWPRLGAFAAGLSLAAAPGLVNSAQAQAQQQKPNILLITGDDIGWFEIGANHQGICPARIGFNGSIYRPTGETRSYDI